MVLAAMHILVPIIFLEILRDRFKKIGKFFSRRHIFVVGLAGILPDLDLIMYRMSEILGTSFPESEVGHRIILHNIWIPLAFLGFFALFYYVIPRIRKMKKAPLLKSRSFGKLFLVLFIGFSIHLILDGVLTGYVMPFYPISDYMVDLNIIGMIEVYTSIPSLSILVSAEALLLLFWLWHQEMRGNIRDYF